MTIGVPNKNQVCELKIDLISKHLRHLGEVEETEYKPMGSVQCPGLVDRLMSRIYLSVLVEPM